MVPPPVTDRTRIREQNKDHPQDTTTTTATATATAETTATAKAFPEPGGGGIFGNLKFVITGFRADSGDAGNRQNELLRLIPLLGGKILDWKDLEEDIDVCLCVSD